MDYARPVEELIPGVQGRVLGVLSRTEMEMTIRTVASLAGASPQQASVIVAHLVDLGIVTRREAGSSALVSLERENQAARLILALAELQESVMLRLADAARHIAPAPASLLVFGSFARGEAVTESDLDVLAVRPAGVNFDDIEWNNSLNEWGVAARKIVGNPVNFMVLPLDAIPELLRESVEPWQSISEEGIPLVGVALSALTAAA